MGFNSYTQISQECNILNVEQSSGASYVCRSIVKAPGYLKEGLQFELHNGQTSVWQQNWIGLGPLKKRV